MKTKLKLFTKWGIKFEEPYACPEKAQRKVEYADKEKIEAEIIRRYKCLISDEDGMEGNEGIQGGIQMTESNAPEDGRILEPYDGMMDGGQRQE